LKNCVGNCYNTKFTKCDLSTKAEIHFVSLLLAFQQQLGFACKCTNERFSDTRRVGGSNAASHRLYESDAGSSNATFDGDGPEETEELQGTGNAPESGGAKPSTASLTHRNEVRGSVGDTEISYQATESVSPENGCKLVQQCSEAKILTVKF
jgi:hypothetical protein